MIVTTEMPNMLGVPAGVIRAEIISIHYTQPSECPECGEEMKPCEKANGAADNVYAMRCQNRHRTHIFKES